MSSKFAKHQSTPPDRPDAKTRLENRYKIGDSFFHIPHEQAKAMLGIAAAKLETEIESLEEKLETIRAEMNGLKVDLYARFGRTINLET